jgi:hydrogenase maturation protease
VVVLGNEAAGDDGAAIVAGRIAVAGGDLDVVFAGRPGVDLLDLLDTGVPVLLVDVVRTGARPGTIVELPLPAILDRAVASTPASSHGFGPTEVLALARSLGRALPRGIFLGVEGARFHAGAPLTDEVAAAVPALAAAIRRVAAALEEDACTSTG